MKDRPLTHFKLFVDDVREPPDTMWTVCRTAVEAVEFLKGTPIVDIISLDHDLGDGPTGYDVICWIEESVVRASNYFPPQILIHSANQVGREKMKAGIRSIYRLLEQRMVGYKF